jgi:hypothetical protein
MRLLLASALFAALPACAQTAPPMPPPAPPPVGSESVDASASDAEARVREIVARDGVHVVHFWAPWCDNSTAELGTGWYEVVERHPEVSFTFVTVWNDGEIGESTLGRYAIPARVERLVVPGVQPPKPERRMTFLDMPVSWIPTTWVFNRNGQLATAFNYGEATPEQLSAAIEGAASTWPH